MHLTVTLIICRGKKNVGAIEMGEASISITDFGEGLDRKRLRLLTTLGGTDKASDPNKIGNFGIGFVSIFNPKLETKTVRVLTCCEEENVELLFTVTDPMRTTRYTSQNS